MKRNLLNYLLALSSLVFCATVYQTGAELFLQPERVAAATPRSPTARPELREALADLFPEGAWQLDDCKRLLTSNGALLFREWHQTSDDKWLLRPVTIVMGRGLSEQTEASPIILSAVEGAEVEFAQSFDVMGGSAPPIKMGRFIGEVTIDRAAGKPSERELAVRTQNVHLDNQKVWSTEDIEMSYGDATLHGRDLTIFLAASATSAASSRRSASVLDRMELVYLEEMRIPIERKLKPNTVATAPEVASILSDGKLLYDFALDRLSVRNNVRIFRRRGNSVVDAFGCDAVDVRLRDPADDSVVRNGPLDWIDRINAVGSPVTARFGDQDMALHAESIDFDALGGLLTASRRVMLRRGTAQAFLSQLTYQYDPNRPEYLGSVDALGGGIVQFSDPEFPVRRAEWRDGFRLWPIEQTTIDAVRDGKPGGSMRVELNGKIVATLNDNGTFRADNILGRVTVDLAKPRIKPQTTIAALPASASVRQPRDPSSREQLTLVPQLFEATGAVSLQSSLADVQTERLSLEFQRSADFAAPQSGTSSPNTVGGFTIENSADSRRSPVSRSRPIVRGDQIAALVLMSPRQSEVTDLSVKGGVNVEHHVRANETLMPVTMSGETMRFIRGSLTQGSGRDRLQLGSGPDAPAVFRLGDGFFVGPKIDAYPSESIVQVAGAGECKVPTVLLKSGSGSTPSDIRWTRSPHCRFQDGLFFDGQTATLNGGVRIDAAFTNKLEPWITSLLGDQMRIRLSKKINLTQRSEERVEVQRIQLVQLGDRPVTVQAEQHTPRNEVEARHLITARELVWDPREGGQVVGTGPGWYRGWALTDSNRSFLSGSKPNAPREPNRRVLQGMHLTFRDAMQADLEAQSLVFRGGVRTGAKEVSSWDEVVDVSEMQRLDLDEMTMDCAELSFGISPDMPADLRAIPGMPVPWEMRAVGGVVLRSRREQGLYEATAARVSYASRKSILVVEGAGNQNAYIKQSNPQGKLVSIVPFERFAFNPKTFEGEAAIESATFGNLPKSNGR
ncbi:MAG: hypothetical protein AAFX06_17855 [Planctomycetota bacterium]